MISSKVRDYTGDFIVIFIVHCVSVHAFVCARKGKDAYKVPRRASDTANSWKTVFPAVIT